MENEKAVFSLPLIENKVQEQGKTSLTFDAKKTKIFSVLMPPPNVTGSLHLGHALNNYLQDVLVRGHRLKGYQTLGIPGFDHAGIATEILVQKGMQTNNLKSQDEQAKKKYFDEGTKSKQKLIRQQGKKLGLLVNDEYEEFTLSPTFQEAVQKAFVQLYEDGLIYRAKKLVNGDPQLKTAISDIEVNHQLTKGKLYFFKYYCPVNAERFIPVATTRPETMFADQAVMVHPDDARYRKGIGQNVVNPLTKKEIPVLAETQIDPEFGSGAVKCTPAHDFFDFKIGEKHRLAVVNCFDEKGELNDMAGEFRGMERLLARPKIIKKLTQNNAFIKEQAHEYALPISGRSAAVIEPFLTEQGFIKTKHGAKILQQKRSQINFIPHKYRERLGSGLKKIEDGCISRQLTGGHRLPLYFHCETGKIKVGLKSPGPEGEQSSDVLDTWFSSGLGSLVNSGGENLQKTFLQKIIPIDYLVTSYDIIFFGVARMLFLHYHFKKKIPFRNILIHGLIRTENNEKMSKSKNNVINPLDLIEQYGSDALRLYLLGNHRIGEDLSFSEEKLVQASQFTHKLGNIDQFLVKYQIKFNPQFNLDAVQEPINLGMIEKGKKLKLTVEETVEKHLFSVAIKKMIDFAGKTGSNLYLRVAGSFLQESQREAEFIDTIGYIGNNYLALLHSFAPMLTQYLYRKQSDQDILNHQYKETKTKEYNSPIMNRFFLLWNLIAKKPKAERRNIRIKVLTSDFAFGKASTTKLNMMLKPFGGVINEMETAKNESFVLSSKTIKNNSNNVESREMDKTFYEQEIARCKKLLDNSDFIQKADPKIVEKERAKLKKYSALLAKANEK